MNFQVLYNTGFLNFIFTMFTYFSQALDHYTGFSNNRRIVYAHYAEHRADAATNPSIPKTLTGQANSPSAKICICKLEE